MNYRLGTISDWKVHDQQGGAEHVTTVTECMEYDIDEKFKESASTVAVIINGTANRLEPLITYLTTTETKELSTIADLLNLDFIPAKNETISSEKEHIFLLGWLYAQLDTGDYSYIVKTLASRPSWRNIVLPLPKTRKIIDLDLRKRKMNNTDSKN